MAEAGSDHPAVPGGGTPPAHAPAVLLALASGGAGNEAIAALQAAGWTVASCTPLAAAPAGVTVVGGTGPRAMRIAAGMAWARAQGHARVIVASGTTVPSPAVLAALAALDDLPEGVVLACRRGGWRHPSRCMAALGVWCAAGHWVSDPAAPLRIVPTTLQVPRGPWRCWEVASIVRAAWQGLPLASRPLPMGVIPPAWSARVAWHASAAWSIAWLLARRAWPAGRGPGDRRLLRALLTSHRSPARLAAAAALGTGLAVAPLPGLQMALTTLAAMALRLNVPLALACSNVSLGPLLLCYYAIATAIGLHLLTHQPFWATCTRLRHELAAHDFVSAWHGPLRACLESWLVGSLILMLVFASLGAIGGYLLGRWLARRRP